MINLLNSLRFRSLISCSQLDPHSSVGSFSRIHASRLGSYSYCSSYCHLIKTFVGRYTSIGPWVKIVAGLHNYQAFSTSPIFTHQSIPNISIPSHPVFDDLNKENVICSSASSTHIQSDVWIGSSVLIYSGVTIGHGSVISAGSLVASNIPPYSICKGIPARVTKKRFSHHAINMLDESEWWLQSPKRASQLLMQFGSIDFE